MSDLLFSVFQDERFMDLTIYQYGYEKCSSLHSFGPFVRNHYLFHYVISGKGTLYADDERYNSTIYQISGGSGFLLFPEYANMYSADKDEPWEYIWIEFGGLRAKECIEMAGLSQKNPIYVPDTPQHGEELKCQMFTFIENQNASSLNLIGRLYLFLDNLIQYSTSRKQLQGGKLSEFYAREAVNFIEQNYARKYHGRRYGQEMQVRPQLFWKSIQEYGGKISAGIFDPVSNDQGSRSAYAYQCDRWRYWNLRRISKSITFFKSI